MRRVSVALVTVVLVVLVWPLSRRAASAPDGSPSLRVATFNIHKGATRAGDYDLDRTIEAIRRLDVDVIGLQEVMQYHSGFRCDDQAALIADGLRLRTGRSWQHVYAPAWFYDRQSSNCVSPRRGEFVQTEGVAIISRDRIAGSHIVRLSEGRVGLAVRLASMPEVPIVVTHLSPNAANQELRVRELATLLPWAGRHGPGILMGDLNARPDTTELMPVFAAYQDGWLEAAASGRISGVTSGSTRPGRRVSRIDYVLYAPAARLAVEAAHVADMGDAEGLGEVSDHHAVAVTFRRHLNPVVETR
jgi:endonuclease/exonuclease/phosphatase family metal-dependent hydrolase